MPPWMCVSPFISHDSFNRYNPSLLQFESGYICTFRQQDSSCKTMGNFLCMLDEDFVPITKPVHIDLPVPLKIEDIRLIRVSGLLYGVAASSGEKCVYLLRLEVAPKAKQVKVLRYGPLRFAYQTAFEKNWTPFEYNGELYVTYKVNPHLVLKVDTKSLECKPVDPLFELDPPVVQYEGMPYRPYSSYEYRVWPKVYGEMLGGTPAIRISKRQYLSFFHSRNTKGVGQQRRSYYLGAYTFSTQPPFLVDAISPEPLLGPEDTNAELPACTWLDSASRVVFPVGIVLREECVYMSFGENDRRCCVAGMGLTDLLASLQPCSKESK